MNCPVVIPARNAQETLPAILHALQELRCLTVVVDDGSTDDTAECARSFGAHVVEHSGNKGKGAALRTGVQEALSASTASEICTMDADGQHDVDDLPGLIDTFRRTGVDLMIGNRRIVGSSMPIMRRLSNTITSFLVSSRTGFTIPDSQCGFRVMSRRCALRAMPSTNGFEAETEWILRAARAGMKIGSSPIRTIYSGERSYMEGWTTILSFIRVLFREY